MDLVRTEPAANLHRLDQMEIVPGLFGDWGLLREWGRIGSPGQVPVDWFESKAAAKNARFDLHMTKAKRG